MTAILPRPGETWRHYYQGALCTVVAVAQHRDDPCDLVVVYTCTGSPGVHYYRPMADWLGWAHDAPRFVKEASSAHPA